jgi:hypothetical protein
VFPVFGRTGSGCREERTLDNCYQEKKRHAAILTIAEVFVVCLIAGVSHSGEFKQPMRLDVTHLIVSPFFYVLARSMEKVVELGNRYNYRDSCEDIPSTTKNLI